DDAVAVVVQPVAELLLGVDERARAHFAAVREGDEGAARAVEVLATIADTAKEAGGDLAPVVGSLDAPLLGGIACARRVRRAVGRRRRRRVLVRQRLGGSDEVVER